MVISNVCGIKIEEYMESELSGIFRVKLVAKNIVLGSAGTSFMHVTVDNTAGCGPEP